MARTIDTYGLRLDRYSGVSGLVGSHGRSQGAFRTRISRQIRASRTRTGRRATGSSSSLDSYKVAGQPRIRPTGSIIPWYSAGRHRNAARLMTRLIGRGPGGGSAPVITAVHLVDGVLQHPAEHGHAVLDPTGGAGQVDDEGAPGQAGQAAGQDRGRYPGRRARGPDGLGDARDLAVEHPPGHLRGQVGRGQAGAAGGQDHVVAGRDRVAQGLLDRFAVRDDQGTVDHVAAGPAQQVDQDRPGPVRVDPGRGPVGDGDRQRAHQRPSSAEPPEPPGPPEPPEPPGPAGLSGRCHRPVLPPVFSFTRMSVMTAPGSTALIMSMRARAATLTEVSASISTPVRSAVRVTAVMSTPSSVTVRSTVTPCSPIGWQSGIRSGVRLAPWMPAIRATASASPLGTSPARNAATAAADSRTRPEAVAVRAVTSLADTSTIRACPDESRWVSSLMGGPEPPPSRLRPCAPPTRAPRSARWPGPGWRSGASPARSAARPCPRPDRARPAGRTGGPAASAAGR